MNQINILKEPTSDKPFIIIDKPSGLPAAPLSANDTENALSQAIQLFPQIKNVKGKKDIEYGLIHRIDTVTSGLVLIACTQEYYNYLLQLQAENKLIKNYKANCLINNKNTELLGGFPVTEPLDINKKNFIISSYFRPFGPGKKEVRPVIADSNPAALKKIGKPVLYTTKLQICSIEDSFLQVECEITNGFRHQVRCHLAWKNLPIIHDSLYNAAEKNNAGNSIEFSAYKLNINGEIYTRKET